MELSTHIRGGGGGHGRSVEAETTSTMPMPALIPVHQSFETDDWSSGNVGLDKGGRGGSVVANRISLKIKQRLTDEATGTDEVTVPLFGEFTGIQS